mgnify:CR=1 FL=1
MIIKHYYAILRDDSIQKIDDWDNRPTDGVKLYLHRYEERNRGGMSQFEFFDIKGNKYDFQYGNFCIIKIAMQYSLQSFVCIFGKYNPVNNTKFYDAQIPLVIKNCTTNEVYNITLHLSPNYVIQDFYNGIKKLLDDLTEYLTITSNIGNSFENVRSLTIDNAIYNGLYLEELRTNQELSNKIEKLENKIKLISNLIKE